MLNLSETERVKFKLDVKDPVYTTAFPLAPERHETGAVRKRAPEWRVWKRYGTRYGADGKAEHSQRFRATEHVRVV